MQNVFLMYIPVLKESSNNICETISFTFRCRIMSPPKENTHTDISHTDNHNSILHLYEVKDKSRDVCLLTKEVRHECDSVVVNIFSLVAADMLIKALF